MQDFNFYQIAINGKPIVPHDGDMDIIHPIATATAIKAYLETVTPLVQYELMPVHFAKEPYKPLDGS